MQAQEADHILIPLLDGDYALAQIARLDGTLALLYVTHRHMKLSSEVFAFGPKDIQAAVFTDLETLPYGHWPVVGYESIPPMHHANPSVLSDSNRTIHAPEIIEALANALHGLYPWDGFPQADFFTNMLTHPDRLPKRARMSADMPADGSA
ncbi:MAG: hypothetical protein KJP02_06695 [Octadecabacter sp.]|nr:hypothetical protein [Octadecabacter sp.]